MEIVRSYLNEHLPLRSQVTPDQRRQSQIGKFKNEYEA